MTRMPRTDRGIFPLNLGGNTFGWTSDGDASFAVLDAFIKAHGIFIDTADLYSVWADGHEGGESETVIGEWITTRGNRDDVIIATKVGGLPTRPVLPKTSLPVVPSRSWTRSWTSMLRVASNRPPSPWLGCWPRA